MRCWRGRNGRIAVYGGVFTRPSFFSGVGGGGLSCPVLADAVMCCCVLCWVDWLLELEQAIFAEGFRVVGCWLVWEKENGRGEGKKEDCLSVCLPGGALAVVHHPSWVVSSFENN